MPRIGLIGCGGMGGTHAAGYQRIADAQVVGYADILPDRAQAFAGKYGGNAYPSVTDLLKAESLDVVDICVPTPQHLPVAMECLERKIPTIMEKPLARTLEDARKLVASYEAAGVPLVPANVVRWFPEFVAARAQLSAGAIGKPAVARITRGGREPGGTGNWFGDFAQSGGVLLDLMIHDFDWLRWVFGEVERVTASSLMAQNGEKGRDYALAVLRFKNGVIAHCEGTWVHTDGFRVEMEISGDKGTLEYSTQYPFPLKRRQNATEDTPAIALPESPTLEDPYTKELREILKAVTGGPAARVTARDGLAALEICEACLKSAASGEPVTLPLP